MMHLVASEWVIPGDLVIVPSPSELSPRRSVSSATESGVGPELE